jgi:hypothetical protein
MITCHGCQYSNPTAFAGSASEDEFYRVFDAAVGSCEGKKFYCDLSCWIEETIDKEFGDKDTAALLAQYEIYAEERRVSLLDELLLMPGVQNFLKRNKLEHKYCKRKNSSTSEMKIETEIKDWADC